MNKVAFINVFKAPYSHGHKCAGNIIRLEQIIFGVPENRLETGAIVPSARNRVLSYFSTVRVPVSCPSSFSSSAPGSSPGEMVRSRSTELHSAAEDVPEAVFVFPRRKVGQPPSSPVGRKKRPPSAFTYAGDRRCSLTFLERLLYHSFVSLWNMRATLL